MTSIPTLTTPRLELRQIHTSDANEIFRNYAQNPRVTHYLTWEVHESIADTHAFVMRSLKELESGDTLPWVIRLSGDPSVVGMIGAHIEDQRAMVGYVLAEPQWGRGLMSEALRAVMDYLEAERPDIARVWAYCDEANPGSYRVMENAGMVREGVLRAWSRNKEGASVDCPVYSWVRTIEGSSGGATVARQDDGSE
jgi:ribosomal-protein-alanine N-acetyltransferase